MIDLHIKTALEQGRSVALVGPQGCGKTRTALALAMARGRYIETDVESLTLGLHAWHSKEVRTVVVDGEPRNKAQREALKALITADTLALHRRHLPSKDVPAPRFIFCSGYADSFDKLADNRRFVVVKL